jgi:S-adenosylmethionine/arginine decarboxylase-like enzyme
MKPSAHLHLVVRALIKDAPEASEDFRIKCFLHDLVARVRMKVLAPASVAYCDEEGNVGWTGVILLTTSHSTIHIWNNPKPELSELQFDIYSCAPYTAEEVIDFISSRFDVAELQWKYLDRDSGLNLLCEGSYVYI